VLVAGGGICGLLCGLALSALGVDCHIYEQRGTSGTSQSGDVAYIITEELDKFLAAHKVAVVSSSRSLLAIAQPDPRDGETLSRYISRSAFAAGTRSVAQRRDEACFPRQRHQRQDRHAAASTWLAARPVPSDTGANHPRRTESAYCKRCGLLSHLQRCSAVVLLAAFSHHACKHSTLCSQSLVLLQIHLMLLACRTASVCVQQAGRCWQTMAMCSYRTLARRNTSAGRHCTGVGPMPCHACSILHACIQTRGYRSA
jgi:hypothetical protein